MPSVRLMLLCPLVLAVPLLAFAQPAAAPPFKDPPSAFASRVVTYGTRDVVPLRAQVRFTTMIVLPAGEQILLEATCGDKELWLVNATQNFAYVKPAKPGSQTNLNLLTSSGTGLLVCPDGGVRGARDSPGRQGLRRTRRRGPHSLFRRSAALRVRAAGGGVPCAGGAGA